MLVYFLFRSLGFFISLLPHWALLRFAQFSGWCAFYIHRPFRKKALANLAIAYGEKKSEYERKKLAIASFQNLMITLLEFFHLKKNSHTFVNLENNSEVIELLKQKQGVIFLSGHQANWEIPFIALTALFPGLAIGRPIKNKRLYDWVLSIRECNGGKIVMPKRAINQGMRALKAGKFLGIVGDQAYPSSSYSYPLFNTRAWTTSTPALLAYKANCPLVVGTTRRIGQHYYVKASSPIWPNRELPVKEEVHRMMDMAMAHLETSIKQCPEQWMWVHDRWKQQGVNHVKRIYRYGFILVVLPPKPDLTIVKVLRKIYTRSFITYYAPQDVDLPNEEVFHYENIQDLYKRDWRFGLMLDFYDLPKLRRHFKKLGVFKALSLPQEQEKILKTLVKPECLTTVSM